MESPIDKDQIGAEMYRLISECYPICRSITGEGVRKTLKLVRDIIPLETHEVPTGTQVFDWEIPQEWNIDKAYIKDSAGNKIINFEDGISVQIIFTPGHTRDSIAFYILPDKVLYGGDGLGIPTPTGFIQAEF